MVKWSTSASHFHWDSHFHSNSKKMTGKLEHIILALIHWATEDMEQTN